MTLHNRKPLGTVAYVGQGPFNEAFTAAWGQLIQFTEQYVANDKVYVNWERGNFSGQEDTRNRLSEIFLGDWLLQLDSDHAFEPDLVQRMLRYFDGWDLDVVTALYQYRVPPYNWTIYKWDEGTAGMAPGYRYVVPTDLSWSAPPFQIDCAGAGTLMVRRRVFDRLKEAFPDVKPFSRYYPWSEDFSFFERCRKLGIKSYCLPSVRTFHLTTTEVQPHQFDNSGVRLLRTEQVQTLVPGENDEGSCLPTKSGALLSKNPLSTEPQPSLVPVGY